MLPWIQSQLYYKILELACLVVVSLSNLRAFVFEGFKPIQEIMMVFLISERRTTCNNLLYSRILKKICLILGKVEIGSFENFFLQYKVVLPVAFDFSY